MKKVPRSGKRGLAVGLTGGVSCGKSTVARLFRHRGVTLLDADRLVHQSMRKGTVETRGLVKRFGRSILSKNGNIDRNRLRKFVDQDPECLRAIEKIVHPGVRRAIRACVRARSRDGLLIVEVPLLFETGLHKGLDSTITVSASASRQKRYARKKGLEDLSLKRFQARQWPIQRKAKAADFVIHNNGTLRQLKKRVSQLYGVLKSQ